MATLEQLEAALRNADAAGAVDDARQIAQEILRVRAAENPRNIGSLSPAGKIVPGKLEQNEILQILKSQRSDPSATPRAGNRDELEREIRRMGGGAASPADVRETEPVEPAAPRASQADVRAAEQESTATPMESFEARQRAWDSKMKQWRLETGGRIPHGVLNEREAAEQYFGVKAPTPEERERAEGEHARETGEVIAGDTVAYYGAQGLASLLGFRAGGPLGATVLNALTRGANLEYNLQKQLRAGNITEEQADDIFFSQMGKGAALDALFNYGLPAAGKIIGWGAGKIPGVSELMARVKRLAEKGVQRATAGLPAGSLAPKGPTPKELKTERLAKQADVISPQRGQAVRELSKRMEGDYVLTEGQATGQPGYFEAGTRRALPRKFEPAEEAAEKAAEQMRNELLRPSGHSPREDLGTRILSLAKDTQKATKERLRPVFESADNIGVKVDMNAVAKRASAELAADAARPTPKLHPKEISHLQDLVKRIEGVPDETAGGLVVERGKFHAADALDFQSTEKEFLRSTTADWKPGKYFTGVVGDMIDDADAAFVDAARRVGKTDVVKNLMIARAQYRETMETVFDGAVEAALKKNPEDIGRLFWQGGNVSEPKQLQRLLDIARREGKLSAEERKQISQSMARGFLQEAIKNPQAAANWSKTLREDPLRRDTWEYIVSTPGGKKLEQGMKMLEEAANIAGATSQSLAGTPILILQRGVSGGQGVGVGELKPGMVFLGLNMAGIARMMASAYTTAEKGVWNNLMILLRSRAGSTGAITEAGKRALPELYKWAVANGEEDAFEFVPVDAEAQ